MTEPTRFQPYYRAYAAAHDRTPSAQWRHDHQLPAPAAPFMTWMAGQYAAYPYPTPVSDREGAEFAVWLADRWPTDGGRS